jgi:hypothetical protein
MKNIIKIFTLLIIIIGSCYKPYDANVRAAEKVLMVNGLITNKTATYCVQLTYALPFDSTARSQPVTSAKVYVTDNTGNIYFYNEMSNGQYISDSLLFTGQPGHIYTLHIITNDGERYESDPQKLFPEKEPDSVYAEFDNQETLNKITGFLEYTHGADIYLDVNNKADTLPHFRFTEKLVIEYFYLICPPFQNCFRLYCWQTNNPNSDINLTGEGYTVNTASVNKHKVCFIDDNLYCYAIIYNQSGIATSDYQSYLIVVRLIYLDQYTLNEDAYLYYKSIDEQLRSEGKLFDPISVQLQGNIKCLSYPGKKTFGFFEASAVSQTSYQVDFRYLSNDQPAITKVPYILPPGSNGCFVNKVPAFWVNL